MPMWARAIIFGIELVGFIIFSIFVIIKSYKNNVATGKSKSNIIKKTSFCLIYLLVNFAIILALFLFAYSSYVFLSYNKLILVSIAVILSILFIGLIFSKSESVEEVCAVTMLVVIGLLLVSTFFVTPTDMPSECKQMISEKIENQSITTLTMFEENQVGYTTDMDGNIKTYIFYYKDENDVWNYKEVNASEIKVEKIEEKDSYIEETVTTKSYCKFEKKSNSKDYISTTEEVEYTLYLNLNQMVQIIKN